MKILAIDTALPAVSVCVIEAGAEQPLASESMAMERGHAESLMPIIERVVGKLEGGFTALDRVAVTVGPGSFTGIRVGISAARAIGLALSIPVVGVSTLSAFAAPIIINHPKSLVGIAIDARHGNVYFAAFADGKLIVPPRIATVREALRSIGTGHLLLAGSGAPMLAIEAWSVGQPVEVVGDLIAPDIGYVARLGMVADPENALARPLYLKAPDAKPTNNTVQARV